MRARDRFLKWTLRADPKVGLRHVGQCLICWKHCVDTPSADKAREWCFMHLGATGHTAFKLQQFEFFDAILTDHPSVNDTPRT
ncbi:DUF7848 domain-containing protein [Streptomyces chattanoogensis]